MFNFDSGRSYMLKRPKNDPKTIQKQSKNDPKTTQKRTKNDPKTTQKRSKNEDVVTIFESFLNFLFFIR